MIILDFSKAFDRVPYRHLLKKIHHYGIRGNTHKWIESFLFNRSQQEVTEDKTSETVPVISGVPQWSVLGPLISFAVFGMYLIRVGSLKCLLYHPMKTPSCTYVMFTYCTRYTF